MPQIHAPTQRGLVIETDDLCDAEDARLPYPSSFNVQESPAKSLRGIGFTTVALLSGCATVRTKPQEGVDLTRYRRVIIVEMEELGAPQAQGTDARPCPAIIPFGQGGGWGRTCTPWGFP